MLYKDLTEQQKLMVDYVDRFYMSHPSITQSNFIIVLAYLIRKYRGRIYKVKSDKKHQTKLNIKS